VHATLSSIRLSDSPNERFATKALSHVTLDRYLGTNVVAKYNKSWLGT